MMSAKPILVALGVAGLLAQTAMSAPAAQRELVPLAASKTALVPFEITPFPYRGIVPDKRGTAWWVGFSPDREQKYLYMMNGGAEEVHVLDQASGKILSSFGRPGHQLGNFTHGHTLAVDSTGNIYVAETDWGRRVQKFKPVN